MKVRLLPEAEADLDDIWYYIALDDPEAATRTIDTILARLRVLARFPGAGREREDLYHGLRSWPINNYVVFYTIDDDIRVARILHGHRDVQRALSQD
ncbi:MAG: type II toxin-antitoxin system RelE/ParE family toxin [Vulcanimicrobiaceae bacterium]